jgi:hypothetical protein
MPRSPSRSRYFSVARFCAEPAMPCSELYLEI